ncbi:hypothetical protein LTR10_022662 [Elasticomyces elasticus]|uniref:FAR-17a/AIG1-like protein n=1 Tax=Exophiala sideris TaxID=1016849 RepID=A0ABR0JS11_9EURO|nr:hypothetical protein LTR10_022662 [Elasticomyces elasticus]KAK5040363.1 hypothetical protein LTS07_000861 [Exophiala sideris]KAK5043210.1 hypothetical protein LTR13_000981 [Exophiala sideris]KAK5068741.1 hypothetical protein LTR69_000862 [Exophiala sideris]KAK5186339.1 hypothetical protein LTR44_001395 [Eurotiomycetes sp. CCFEE 6388]
MPKSKAFSLHSLIPLDIRPFTTSWILPPLFLALLRLLFFTYCLATQLTNWIYDGVHSTAYLIGQEFSYFTILTYWGLLFWSLVAGVHTLVYATKGHSWLENWPRVLQALHSFFYTTIVTLPFLVTIVYWAVLYKGPWFPVVFNAWSNISKHALNSLFALFEVTLPATNPPPLLHLVGLIILLLLYLSLAYLTRYTEGFYVYDFLDPSKGKGRVAAYCFGIFAAIVIIFCLVTGLIWLRRKFTGDGKLSKNDMRSHLPVVEEYEMSRDVEVSK